MLNGVGRFAAAAFSPSVLNLVLIAALIYIYSTGEIGSVHAGVLLTSAITVGGVIQVVFLYVACRMAGIAPSFRLPQITAGVRRLTSLAWPSVIAGGITQINIVVGTIIASLQAGAVSWLYYADRLYQLPLGIVGIAIGVVLLPDLSRALRAGRDKDASHAQNRSIEFAAALTLPAAVALFVIPWEIVQVLFQHGAFSAADTAATAPALAAYAAGLPAFVAIKVLQPGFFAREDTRTPMRYGFVSMVVNVVAAFVLFYLFGHVGIAAATSIAAWVNTAAPVHDAEAARPSRHRPDAPAPAAAPRRRLPGDGGRLVFRRDLARALARRPRPCRRGHGAGRADPDRPHPLCDFLPGFRRVRFSPRRRPLPPPPDVISACAADAAPLTPPATEGQRP